MRTFISLGEENNFSPANHELWLEKGPKICIFKQLSCHFPSGAETETASLSSLVSVLGLSAGQRSHWAINNMYSWCVTAVLAARVSHLCSCLSAAEPYTRAACPDAGECLLTPSGSVSADLIIVIIIVVFIVAPVSHRMVSVCFSGRITLQPRDSNMPEAVSRAALKRRKPEVGPPPECPI